MPLRHKLYPDIKNLPQAVIIRKNNDINYVFVIQKLPHMSPELRKCATNSI